MTAIVEGYQRFGSSREPGSYRGAVVLPHDRSGRVLLQQRDDIAGIIAPGRWGLFGGEIETGETPQQAAARELNEETGLSYPPADFAPFVAVVSSLPPYGLLYVHHVKVDANPWDIVLKEGTGLSFSTPRQAAKLDLIPHLAEVLAHFWQKNPDLGKNFARNAG